MRRLVLCIFSLFLFVLVVPPIYLVTEVGATDVVSTDVAKLRTEAKVKRQEELEKLKLEREENKLRLQAAREAVKESNKTKREEFKNKLQEIKVERKKLTLEIIADKLDKINDRWVNHWTLVLDRLDQLASKMSSRADRLEEEGKDVNAVRVAVSDAHSKILAARKAIETQAANEYVIELSDEAEIKTNVQIVTDKLRQDLEKVKMAVVEAREACRIAIDALKVIED
ncbi:hypothetical protein IPM62_05000 [Candidatus Woesebacteria bacterium]|nr:MAG: hypothetical protein IPM62_05000 [Candidatus Woesebacteria bacterium]